MHKHLSAPGHVGAVCFENEIGFSDCQSNEPSLKHCISGSVSTLGFGLDCEIPAPSLPHLLVPLWFVSLFLCTCLDISKN